MTKATFLAAAHRLAQVCVWVFAAALWSGAAGVGGDAGIARRATQILDATGVRGGLVVHIGCGDGKLTAALRVNDSYLVHGLDRDAANVAKARAWAHGRGVYGPVSVAQFDGKRLPYADGLVNLVVAEDAGGVAAGEILRVLVPGGVAYARREGAWTKATKPWPEALDEWTHYLHDASNDCTARDEVVGPPQRLQWHCGPLWTRSHEYTSSLVAMVSAGGRLFYLFDEGLTGVTPSTLPERWVLIARDAFNGTLLWRRPIDDCRGSLWKGTSLRGRPPSVPRLLVAEGDRLFMPLGLSAAVSILDAATGKALATCEGSEAAQELRCLDGVLLVRKGKEGVLAFDARTAEKLWAVADNAQPLTLAAQNGRVFYQVGLTVTCLDLKTGKRLWKTQDAAPAAPAAKPKRGRRRASSLLVVHGDYVLFSGRKGLTAVSAGTGATLWSGKGAMGRDAFVAGGKLWRVQGRQAVGIDLKTGERAAAVDASDVFTAGHHPRCYQGKATVKYLITPNRGIEFVSLTGGKNTQHDWARGPCRYGIMPANGLLYAPPHPCFCYPGVKLTGFNALASASAKATADRPASPRLQKGPALGELSTRAPQLDPSATWPTYRHDPRRTGATACTVPTEVAARWTVALGGPLTPPVADGERLYVAAKNAHTLYALRVADGSTAWRFTAGGRIDSPPTLHGGLVLLGCTDGHVYCLRAADGELAWRFRAAPTARRIVASSQLESAWRVHGSVLVHEGVAYCTAGRSTYLDGGIAILGLDPATGKALHQTTLDTWARTRVDAEGKPFVPGYHIEGAHSDILVSEGGYIFMGQYKLDGALAEQDVPYIIPGKDEKVTAMDLTGQPFVSADVAKTQALEVHQRKWLENAARPLVAELRKTHGGFNLGHRRMGRHVLTTGGFLDDSWFNRTYWMYADAWPGYYLAHRGAKTGQLLVVGPERTYAVQAYPRRNMQSPLFTPGEKGYLLFADRNDNEPVLGDRTRETTKGWGFTRKAPPVWHAWVPVRIRAMVLAGSTLFVAGPPDVVDPEDPMAAFDGRKGAVLWAVAAADGKKLAELRLASPPVFDGLIAAKGRLFLATTDGKVLCLGGKP